jgi:hypothetical protein
MALEIPVAAHGDCEYCEGGAAHGSIMEAAARLRRGARTLEQPTTVTKDGNLFLRVVNVPAASGCSSCGTH